MNLKLPPHLLPHIARDKRGRLLKPEAIKAKLEAKSKPKPEAAPEPEPNEEDDVSPKIRVTSEPTDARVYWDNEKIGRTPIELEHIPGEHELRVSKTGYKTAYYTVTEPSAIYAELEWHPVVALLCGFLRGVYDPGEHELRVSKTGYKTAYYTVTEPSAIYAELEKR